MTRIASIILLDIVMFPVGIVITILTAILMIFVSMICSLTNDYELIKLYITSIPEFLFPGRNIVDERMPKK